MNTSWYILLCASAALTVLPGCWSKRTAKTSHSVTIERVSGVDQDGACGLEVSYETSETEPTALK